MNVLIVGSGGREHALAWKIAQDPAVQSVYVAPGNPGTALEPKIRNVALDGPELVAFAAAHVGLVVIGPEVPLVAGLATQLRKAGVAVVGPGPDGALLEGSKAYCKEVIGAARVPTARWARVSSKSEVDAFVDAFDGTALVVKADGLAAGKGVVVCDDVESAREVATGMLRDRTFGAASDTLVLEERLVGIETSYIVLTDGERFVPLPTSQDHKRLLDGDLGPNTGGMGAFTPAPFVTAGVAAEIEARIIVPTLAELRRRGIDYRGFLYAGVMLTASGPMVLEFNVRLGDPETQALMMSLGPGFVDALHQAATGHLEITRFEDCRPAAVVVLAAEGYPSHPKRGATISGIGAADVIEGVKVFHAGTRLTVGGGLVVDGGRVLGVAATADSPAAAVVRAYEGVAHVSFEGAQVRSDIGKAL